MLSKRRGEDGEDYSSLAGLQITRGKNKQNVSAAPLIASLQHMNLALSTGIIQLSLRNGTLNPYNYQETLSLCFMTVTTLLWCFIREIYVVAEP